MIVIIFGDYMRDYGQSTSHVLQHSRINRILLNITEYQFGQQLSYAVITIISLPDPRLVLKKLYEKHVDSEDPPL